MFTGWETVPVTSKGKSSAGSSQRSAPAITSAAVKQPAFSARVAPVISSAKSANATKTAPVVPKENQAPKASTAASRAANNVSKVNPSINATVSSTKYEEEIQSLKATIEEQDSVTSDLRLEVEVVQKERDFYFEKLRDIEVLLQQIEDEGRGDKTTAAILKILYATADGFEPVVNPIESEDQATEPYQEPYTKPYTEPYSEPFSEAENLEVEPIALEQESY